MQMGKATEAPCGGESKPGPQGPDSLFWSQLIERRGEVARKKSISEIKATENNSAIALEIFPGASLSGYRGRGGTLSSVTLHPL